VCVLCVLRHYIANGMATVSVWERERETERETDRDKKCAHATDKQRDEGVCVYVCVGALDCYWCRRGMWERARMCSLVRCVRACVSVETLSLSPSLPLSLFLALLSRSPSLPPSRPPSFSLFRFLSLYLTNTHTHTPTHTHTYTRYRVRNRG